MREDRTTPKDSGRSQEILQKLFFKFRESLIMESYGILRDLYEAEDVVQETFIILWEKDHLAHVKPAAYRSYLYCAVRNNSLSRQRVVQNNQRKQDRFSETAPQFEHKNYGEVWEIRKRINEAVQTLPEQRRWAFIKSHLDRKTYREVGLEMGLNMETVRSHVKIALKTLRELLGNLK